METQYFYVTIRRNERTCYAVGPCYTHETALSLVDKARDAANKADPYTAFDSFGTASVTWDHKLPLLPTGRLNTLIGFDDSTQQVN